MPEKFIQSVTKSFTFLVVKFYENLYASKGPEPDSHTAADPRAVPTERLNKDIVPTITCDEIRYALGTMKHNNASGEDGVHVEMLQAGREHALAVVVKLFNGFFPRVLHPGPS